LLPKIQKAVAESHIPVAVIDSVDYGTMNGAVVLEKALKL